VIALGWIVDRNLDGVLFQVRPRTLVLAQRSCCRRPDALRRTAALRCRRPRRHRGADLIPELTGYPEAARKTLLSGMFVLGLGPLVVVAIAT